MTHTTQVYRIHISENIYIYIYIYIYPPTHYTHTHTHEPQVRTLHATGAQSEFHVDYSARVALSGHRGVCVSQQAIAVSNSNGTGSHARLIHEHHPG